MNKIRKTLILVTFEAVAYLVPAIPCREVLLTTPSYDKGWLTVALCEETALALLVLLATLWLDYMILDDDD